jgi:tetratricopeptide (TPR) repeat protein
MQVKAWKELVKIPTYKIGEPDRNPMFLEKRVYQGSSGVVYPHPVVDKVFDEKEEKEWIALYIENEYLKVMVLPELGGRIQMAYDKTNDYHFIYNNSVIKPALVGLAGPWISGGIEFNWPQHHRPSTFSPTDFTIEDNADGSKTIWVNEYEIMFRTKCALGITLYPGKSYIELHAKLYNRTPFPQTFLWWANPAVSVDEHYQSVFPPDVYAVYDHGKRDVSSFPIATGTYYKVDYSPGTDISKYNNILVPTSYMAVNSEYDFVGGYHHKKKAGMMHVADHNISPGKKQWTWGAGEFGKAWDRQLTDNDGPYFELMCGVYTDNQPDFSWIMPNESREFRQYFMPYKEIGYVKNASIDAMVNLDIEAGVATIGVYVTAARQVNIILREKNSELYNHETRLTPGTAFTKNISLPSLNTDLENYTIEVRDEKGQVLISYSPVAKKDIVIPEPAKPIAQPSELQSNEDLYLAGLHLEQYRHATYNAEDYYSEAIWRDDSDIRSNNALGLLLLRRGEYKSSEFFFRKAIEKLNKHNPNPYDAEPLYNLGICLKFQARNDEASVVFYKCTWNASLQDNAYLQLAYIECSRRNWNDALALIEKSLNRNAHSLKARHLKAMIQRKLKQYDLALKWIHESLLIDHFDFGSRHELYKVLIETNNNIEANRVLEHLNRLMRGHTHNYIEIAIDYAGGGAHMEAAEVLSYITGLKNDPLLFYYAGYYAHYKGDNEDIVKGWMDKAFACSPDRVFPNRLEDIEVLKFALKINSGDFKALYYMGNFYYGKRRYDDAGDSWRRSIAIYDGFATTHRNLGIACFNKFNEKANALDCYERAFEIDNKDSRVLFELDQLYKRLNNSPQQRLSFLQKHRSLIEERDDLYTEYVLLHTLTGQYRQAKQLLEARNFHPWEGGEGKTSGLHVLVHIELGKLALSQNKLSEALALLQAATQYPENLGEGKLYGAQENDIFYWLGCVYDKMNRSELALECWTKASVGSAEPAQAVFYNDQQPDKIFYQGLALLQLQKDDEAHKRFHNLIDYGIKQMNKEIKMDYFAVSLPDLMIFDDDLSLRNNIHCNFLQALGYLGLNDWEQAEHHFKTGLILDPAHTGIIVHQTMLDQKKKERTNAHMSEKE